ncbi:MAG: alpha/beta fold hydrolase, partial [Woeseiaceae bacterium]
TTFQALGNAGFRAIRFDTYGRGYSDRPNAVYDGALFDRQINGLLDGLGVDQPVDIIGLSMGGAVTARFVANNPERVRRIIFIDPTNESWGTPTLPRPIGDIMMALRLFPAIAEGQMSDFLYPEDYPAWVERYEVQMQFKGFRNAIVSTIYDFGPEDHLANFARIQPLNKQVLLIWGLQDQTVPVSGAETVQSVLDVEYLPIDDCGHLPHIEQADIVNPAIIKFLQK